MGIRVHKAVGWGLTGVKFTKRLKKQLELLGDSDLTPEQFCDWMKENETKIKKLCGKRYQVHDCFKFDVHMLQSQLETYAENDPASWSRWLGMGNFVREHCMEDSPDKLLFHADPPFEYRHDDKIDWIEETEMAGVDNYPTDRWVELKRHEGIYPYDAGPLPTVVAAIMLYLGLQNRIEDLKPVLWVWWA